MANDEILRPDFAQDDAALKVLGTAMLSSGSKPLFRNQRKERDEQGWQTDRQPRFPSGTKF